MSKIDESGNEIVFKGSAKNLVEELSRIKETHGDLTLEEYLEILKAEKAA